MVYLSWTKGIIQMNAARVHDLSAILTEMRTTASTFHSLALFIGSSAFVEFAKLVAEYADICEATLKGGRDFSIVGTPLVITPDQACCLFARLGLIYGPAASRLSDVMMADHEYADSLIAVMDAARQWKREMELTGSLNGCIGELDRHIDVVESHAFKRQRDKLPEMEIQDRNDRQGMEKFG